MNKMCLSVPGKIIKIENEKFIIDYNGDKREAKMSLVDVKVGDYVIVNNKIIVAKIKEGQAKKFLEIIKNVGG